MSRKMIWLLICAGSALYNLPRGNVDTFYASVYFSQLALVAHWLFDFRCSPNNERSVPR